MKHQVLSVYDEKVEAYLQPVFVPTIASGIRSISDLANDGEHTFCKHATDYSLHFLGTLDDKTGIFDQTGKRCLHSLVELRQGNAQFEMNMED